MSVVLTPEYQAAVNLGYLNKEQAERELQRWDVVGIDSDDELQRKAFRAGYLWGHFKFGWEMTEADLISASTAWDEWCRHMAGK